MFKRLLLFCAVLAFAGCGKKATEPAKTDSAQQKQPKAKDLLTIPFNKKAFSEKVLGLSTREIREQLGAPDEIVRVPGLGLCWGYQHRNVADRSKVGTVLLVIENDRVVNVD